MSRFSLLVGGLALLAGAGCHWTLNDPGTEPLPAQFYFPTGIAIDPGLRYAYVSNSNADLAYGGGTITMVDLKRFECTIQLQTGSWDPVYCGDAAAQQARATDAGSCRPDPLDTSIIDCDETAFILQNSTVKVGNFAGSVRLRQIDDVRRQLYVAVRGDPSITFLKVDLSRPRDQPGVLNCFDNVDSLVRRPGYHAATNTTSQPPGCDQDFLLQQYVCSGQPSCVAGLKGDGSQILPPEPFGMQLDESSPGSAAPYARLVVSHLAGGQVSLFNLQNEPPTIASTSPGFFSADSTGRHGAFQLAQQNRHDPHSLWYLTSDIQPNVATFRIADATPGIVVPSVSFAVTVFPSGSDVRDIVFDPTGDRAFITENFPPSLFVLDTRKLPGLAGGLPVNQVVDVVDVCQTPSHIGVKRVLRAAADGSAMIKTQVFVICFLSGQAMIVDPDRPGVDQTILMKGGPNEIGFNFDDDDAPPRAAPPSDGVPPRRGYVTGFVDSTISVIDLVPGSPTYNRVIARIGIPGQGAGSQVHP